MSQTENKKPWSLDQLKTALARRPEIKDWIVYQEHTHRRERYFMMDQGRFTTDQDREVRAESINLKITVKKPSSERQGEISKKLFPVLALEPQIDSAIAAALETDHQAWSLPTSAPTNLPTRKSTDPRMAEDLDGVMDEATARIAKAVAQPQGQIQDTKFNSSELFSPFMIGSFI